MTQSESLEPKSTQPHQHKVTQFDSLEPKQTQPHRQHKVTQCDSDLAEIGILYL